MIGYYGGKPKLKLNQQSLNQPQLNQQSLKNQKRLM